MNQSIQIAGVLVQLQKLLVCEILLRRTLFCQDEFKAIIKACRFHGPEV
jgi:hypothetical protein